VSEPPVSEQPTLRTPRLTLRPFAADDAFDVERLAGAREIADTTLNIPHPYPHGGAAQWIGLHGAAWREGTSVTFAVESNETGKLVGAISLTIKREFARGELGYWIAKDHWSTGYATEASEAILEFGFRTLGLHRIQAHHLVRNPASGRVMQKLGMQQEGIERDAVIKWGRHESIVLYSILEPEWRESRYGR
jgi:ribosomal-protein-alanine N-acetyltransferase